MIFGHVKDSPVQINAQELATVSVKMYKQGAKLTTSRSAKNF